MTVEAEKKMVYDPLKESELSAESGCVTPKLLELEDAEEQKLKEDVKEKEICCPPRGEDSVVFYTTSLGAVRKTSEDCKTIRILLELHKVMFKERDVSRDPEFLEEMRGLLGREVIPPRLFIRGKYIGGADEVVALNEDGKLKKLLEGISKVNSPCKRCQNERFLICSNCHGSLKIPANGEECGKCNENGLVKCPLCS